jgi:hypothetical protein
MYAFVSTYWFIDLSICRPACLSLFVCLSLSVFARLCLSIFVSSCLFLSLSVFVCLSHSVSVSVLVSVSVCALCAPLCPSVSVCLPVCLSTCLKSLLEKPACWLSRFLSTCLPRPIYVSTSPSDKILSLSLPSIFASISFACLHLCLFVSLSVPLCFSMCLSISCLYEFRFLPVISLFHLFVPICVHPVTICLLCLYLSERVSCTSPPPAHCPKQVHSAVSRAMEAGSDAVLKVARGVCFASVVFSEDWILR